MKATGFFLLLLVWQTSFSQFTDSFDDGNFTENPPWSGQTADFSIIDGVLRLTAPPATSSSYLVVFSQSINNASWHFSLGMAFNPSSSNYTEVYLVADSPNLDAEVNGYLLRIGWTTDNLTLVRQDGMEKQVILSGPEKRLDMSAVDLEVLVTRSVDGEWHIQSRLASESSWVDEGSVTDHTYYSSGYFGIKCNYTSTRSDKFSFDDFSISGEPFLDQDPPAIDSVFSTSDAAVTVIMTEDISENSAQPEKFRLNGFMPDGVALTGSRINLSFSEILEVENALEVNGLADLTGNVMAAADYEFIHYSFEPLQFGDIVFNEILPDPSPPADLPEVEYIEIINASSRAIDMTNWSLSDRTSGVILPGIKLKPDSIVVLYRSGVGVKWPVTNVVELNSWPSLNNSEDEFWLRDNTNKVIDYLVYNSGLYFDNEKKEGGWSLERMDPYLPCSGEINWRVSEHPNGGTPGRLNSVFEPIIDHRAPELLELYAFAEDSTILYFSEPLGNLPLQIIVEGLEVRDYQFGLRKQELVIKTTPMLAGHKYQVEITGIADCSGNTSGKITATVILPETLSPGDLILNEILFNPIEERQDYLEVFNLSGKYLSLLDLVISNGQSMKTITSYQLIEPGGYRVFSPAPEEILEYYSKSEADRIIKQPLPSFNNDSGLATLKTDYGLIVDSVTYDESWHFAYLNDFEGISLERISPYRDATTKSNWASASSQNNFGTPGYENSQSAADLPVSALRINPAVIVPNADGRDDFTTITLRETANAVVTIRVFNLYGHEIRMLVNNEALSGESYFTWDGTDEHGQVVPLGHYIVVAELVKEQGESLTLRRKLVVGTGY